MNATAIPVNGLDEGLHFGAVISQQRRSWAEMSEQWAWAEESGWDSGWAFDHFMSLYDDESNPCLDGWTLLAGLGATTRRLRLGLLVSGVTHRHPALLAKQVATVDHISGGRLILGLGAGWNQREHEAYGIPYFSDAERVARTGEALDLYRRLESGERTSFTGRFYNVSNAPFAPKPVQGRVPVLIGAAGRGMLRHVARHADIWDARRCRSTDDFRSRSALLDQFCHDIGRDPRAIRRSISREDWSLFDSEDGFRRFVAEFFAVGARAFLLYLPHGSPSPTMRAIAERVIPELRATYAAGRLA